MNLNIQESENGFQVMKDEIMMHPAWYGKINGMLCETILRDHIPYTFLIRQGEEEFHYYLSFVQGEVNNFKHQPFVIEHSSKQWFYRNMQPHWSSTLEGLIPLIMHCKAEQGIALKPKSEMVRFI